MKEEAKYQPYDIIALVCVVTLCDSQLNLLPESQGKAHELTLLTHIFSSASMLPRKSHFLRKTGRAEPNMRIYSSPVEQEVTVRREFSRGFSCPCMVRAFSVKDMFEQ